MREYKTKIVELNSDRRLINAVKKAGINTYHPTGRWNGYGYDQLPLVAQITSLSEMRKFNKIKKEVEDRPAPKKKTEEEIRMAWAKRLVKLIDDPDEVTLEEALEIADEKTAYKDEKINEMCNRQYERYSVKREKLINKMRRANPLRRIKDQSHAWMILNASRRHNCTGYEAYLEEGHWMEDTGSLEKGTAKAYPYDMIRYGKSDLVIDWHSLIKSMYDD